MSELTHYFELKAIPQAEMTQNEIMSLLFEGIHRQLPPFKGRVGIGFPGYGRDRSVGGIIRLFGNEEDITALNQMLHSQSEMTDYALMTVTKPIPSKVLGHYQFRRLRRKGMSDLRRAKARLTQQGKWNEEVSERMIAHFDRPMTEPFLRIQSQSTGQKFSLWIKRRRINESDEGVFSHYGLSHTRTIPNF